MQIDKPTDNIALLALMMAGVLVTSIVSGFLEAYAPRPRETRASLPPRGRSGPVVRRPPGPTGAGRPRRATAPACARPRPRRRRPDPLLAPRPHIRARIRERFFRRRPAGRR